ncbi:microcystin degradation protein MlrC [Sneathiella sp. P13V-1]|uniref:M81 family metallopeptidase n=1 Tax=Sneathiella sp. P13V-1 TaxID=2697366 RepID=UPI00187BA60F|nr:M81 family metallopeptidase [Sneathiella sp. P13V-1]MBE7636448.1 microcystin degradation protein MlrC [Sneathiella sp. P13V-1]
MRILIAMMKHETNTFSPIPANWQRFEDWGVHFGEDARAAYEGTAMPMGAYIELAKSIGAEIVTPVAAEAMPSGLVTEEAYEKLAGAILDEVRNGVDAAMLDLHGAMVSEVTPDGEGTLLERIREIDPDLPIAVTLDLHCNLTEKMVSNCTTLIGYKTYPHVDMYEVGTQIGQALLDSLDGKVDPVMSWGNVPLLSQTLCQGTDDEPMATLIRMCVEAEKEPGVLAATAFGGFALADMPDSGNSVIIVTDGDKAKADEVRDRILAAAWDRREDFIYKHAPLADKIAEAKAIEEGPVILLDHADNCGSGATQDVMTVIGELHRQQLEDVAVGAVWDPVAVQEMQKAGIGNKVTLKLGGKTDMPSIGEVGEPLEITGTVKVLTNGEWTVHGPMYTGVKVFMGPSAVLDTGRMEIVIVSNHHEPWDVGVFTSMGIQPEHKKYIVLKSRIHYRAGFAGLAKATLTLDGKGVTTSDNNLLEYKNVRRPIYPLDLINEA